MNTAKNLINANESDILEHFIRTSPVAMMCTQEGSLIHSRPMYTLMESTPQALLFLAASPTILENSLVTLCYTRHDDFQYVCVHGSVHISKDRSYVQKLWKTDFEKWFKDGPNDPNLSVMSVTPKEIEIWDHFKNEKMALNNEDIQKARRSYDAKVLAPKKFVDLGNSADDDSSGYSWTNQKTPEQPALFEGEHSLEESHQNASSLASEEDQAKSSKEAKDSQEVSAAILNEEITQG